MKFLLPVLLLLSHISASDVELKRRDEPSEDGYFVYPPRDSGETLFSDNPQYELGTSKQIQWRWEDGADWWIYTIFMLQWTEESSNRSLSPIFAKQEYEKEQGYYDWTVATGMFDLSVSNVFWLNIYDKGDTSSGNSRYIASHYFNITESKSESSTTTSTTGPTGTPTAPITTPTPAPQPDTNNSKILRIGLGVGLGVGIPLVLLVGIFVGLKIMRNRAVDPTPEYVGPGDPSEIKDQEPAPSYHEGHESASVTNLASPVSPSSRFSSRLSQT